MQTIKYKVIHTSKAYQEYCTILDKLVGLENITQDIQDEIELLTLLIQNWDSAHNTFYDDDPIKLLKSLMKNHSLKSKDLVELTGMSKGYISDILNYKKGLSKTAVRIFANHFKVAQEAFNRPYDLVDKMVNNHKESRALTLN